MRKLFLLLIGLSCLTYLEAQTSYIQVISEPGISVYLDGELKGKTSTEFDGLVIQNVSSGNHKIKFVKEGFNPQEMSITITSGIVLAVTVKPFVPAIKVSQSGNPDMNSIKLSVGKLLIQSIPVSVNINIPKLKLTALKLDYDFLVEDIPVGTYPVTFSWKDKKLYDTIQVVNGKEVKLFVDFVNLKVENRNLKAIDLNKNALYKAEGNANGSSEQSQQELTTGLSYNLSQRKVLKLSKPECETTRFGVVVVEITVNRNGKVIAAISGVIGSTLVDNVIYSSCKKAALNSVFDTNFDAPERQIGTITYRFEIK
jgi:hypothetical protein